MVIRLFSAASHFWRILTNPLYMQCNNEDRNAPDYAANPQFLVLLSLANAFLPLCLALSVGALEAQMGGLQGKGQGHRRVEHSSFVIVVCSFLI